MKNIEPNFNNSCLIEINIQSAKSESSNVKMYKEKERENVGLSPQPQQREMPMRGRTILALRWWRRAVSCTWFPVSGTNSCSDSPQPTTTETIDLKKKKKRDMTCLSRIRRELKVVGASHDARKIIVCCFRSPCPIGCRTWGWWVLHQGKDTSIFKIPWETKYTT